MAVIAFTKRYADRSKPEGFQFEFYCDRSRTTWQETWQELLSSVPTGKEVCTYSYVTPLLNNPANVTAKFVEDAKKFMESEAIGAAGKVLNQAVNEKAKEYALTNAITGAKQHFRYCTECNRWVCKSNCWNKVARLCKDCAPPVTQTLPRVCAKCGDTSTGKFCPTCGGNMMSAAFCGNCGSKVEIQKGFRFCPFCGDSLAYLLGST
jgi:hypothetical protein